jgi:hypothetical protein
MKIFSDSFVIDFESVANNPNVCATAKQLQEEFQHDPALFIDKYIEEFTEFFRPVDLGIINDPLKEEIFGQEKRPLVVAEEDDDDGDDVLFVDLKTKILYVDDLITLTQADEKIFDLTLFQCDQLCDEIDCIDLSGIGGKKLILDVASVLHLTNNNNTLTIVGDHGDEVMTMGEWIAQGMIEIEGHNYVQYVQELKDKIVKLMIHANIIQTNGI